MIVTAPQPTRRDQWGRYLVVPPQGGKPAGYTRATTIAKALDDTSNLQAWACRMTAIGLAQRPDLLAMVATNTDNKKTLDDLCERAKEAGGATTRRDLGTALHSMIEQSYTTAGYVAPGPYAADVAAVHDAIAAAGLEVVEGMHEQIVVSDRHRIAGTFDLILTDGHDLFIGDIKTGSSINYGALGFAVQLGIYATADNLYVQGSAKDGSEDRREPMPAVSRTEAVIVHVEPGSAVCTLHRLDIGAGVEALEIAMAVRGWRARRGLLVPLVSTPTADNVTVGNAEGGQDDPALPAHLPPPSAAASPGSGAATRRQWLVDRVRGLVDDGHAQTLIALWPAGIPTFKTGHQHTAAELDAICEAVDQADTKHRRPFPATTDPAHPEPAAPPIVAPAPVVEPEPPAVLDNGGPIDEDDIAATGAALDRRTVPQRAVLQRWAAEANSAGVPINVRAARNRRVWHIVSALIACVSADVADDDVMHAILDTAHVPDGATVGGRVGRMSLLDAERVHMLADALGTPALTLNIGPDGITLTGPATTTIN